MDDPIPSPISITDSTEIDAPPVLIAGAPLLVVHHLGLAAALWEATDDGVDADMLEEWLGFGDARLDAARAFLDALETAYSEGAA